MPHKMAVASADEKGFGLIEAALALGLIALVVLPVSWLVMNSGTSLSDYRATAVGSKIALSQLNQLEEAATVAPDSLSVNNSAAATWVNPTTVLAGCTKAVSGIVSCTTSNITFDIYEAGGYCALSGSTSGSSWTATSTLSTPNVTQYFVAVKVVWAVSSSSIPSATSATAFNSVVMSGAEGGTQSGAPASGGAVDQCPVGLS